jgi:MFS transporter, DHA1 family, inner membrane transport protein
MSITGNTKKPLSNLNAVSFAAGLSAWLGGAAFCIGFGITAPSWVALGLGVVALAITGLSSRVAPSTPADPGSGRAGA